jgi:7-keto-8-aminopelargonate synthetase-like enzyme
VRVGTLSKALGSIGGFVAGSQPLIDWLANRARPYVFSTAFPEAMAAAGLAALQIVCEEPHRRTALLERAQTVREGLRRQGWSTGDSQSQIIPVVIGDAGQTMQLAASLRQAGLWIPGIRPPTVPPNESLLRISLSHNHTDEMLDALQRQFGKLAQIH